MFGPGRQAGAIRITISDVEYLYEIIRWCRETIGPIHCGWNYISDQYDVDKVRFYVDDPTARTLFLLKWAQK